MSRISKALALFAVVALAVPLSVAQPPGADGPPLGKFLTIVKKSHPTSSIDLENPRLAKIDTRTFIVGVGADTPDNWQKGKTVWVALDDVSDMTSFASLEELRKAGQLQDVPKGEAPPLKK